MFLTSPMECENKRGEEKAGDIIYRRGPTEVSFTAQKLRLKSSTYWFWSSSVSGFKFLHRLSAIIISLITSVYLTQSTVVFYSCMTDCLTLDQMEKSSHIKEIWHDFLCPTFDNRWSYEGTTVILVGAAASANEDSLDHTVRSGVLRWKKMRIVGPEEISEKTGCSTFSDLLRRRG